MSEGDQDATVPLPWQQHDTHRVAGIVDEWRQRDVRHGPRRNLPDDLTDSIEASRPEAFVAVSTKMSGPWRRAERE